MISMATKKKAAAPKAKKEAKVEEPVANEPVVSTEASPPVLPQNESGVSGTASETTTVAESPAIPAKPEFVPAGEEGQTQGPKVIEPPVLLDTTGNGGSETVSSAPVVQEVNPTTPVPSPINASPADMVTGSSITSGEKSDLRNKIIFVLVPAVILGALITAGIVLFKQGAFDKWLGKAGKQTVVKTKPVVSQAQPTPTSTASAQNNPATVDKMKFAIKILNGSGVSGEAAKEKAALTTAGFNVTATGNADSSDVVATEIAAKKSVTAAFLDALKTELSKTYVLASASGSIAESASVDVVVTLGSKTK